MDRLMAWFLGTDEATQIDKVSAGMLPFGAIQPLAILAPTSLAMRACSAQASPCQCLGGPLYPPVAGLLYVPLSVWRPRIAYRLAQIGNLFCSLFAAVAIWQLSKKGYRLPFVWCLVLLFPGCIVSMSLGQNAAFSLSLLAWGWLLAKRGHDWSAGMVWGILVYKPVWLVAFFTVPVLSRRWTMAAAMAASSLLFVLLSLPFVGTQSWLNWLRLAPEAFETYRNDPTWIRHSRDLLSLPYQWSLATASAWNSILAAAGWSLLGAVMLTTFSVALCRPRSMTDATAAGCCFILLGAWLSCIHFMHYDVLLAALPVLILSARPHYRLPRVIHTFLAGCLLLTPGAPGWSGMAWETMAILMLWIWCGWQVWAGGIAPRWLPSLAEGQVVVRELSPTAMP